LIFFSTINFTINYRIPAGGSNSPSEIKMRGEKYSMFSSQLSNVVFNNSDISQFLTGIVVDENIPKQIEDLPTNDYLVIATEEFVNSQAMNNFVLWKKKRGIDI